MDDDDDQAEEWVVTAGDEQRCWTCDGQQWVIVGVDIDCDDAINGPYDGEIIECPNCLGSGKAVDCWYW